MTEPKPISAKRLARMLDTLPTKIQHQAWGAAADAAEAIRDLAHEVKRHRDAAAEAEAKMLGAYDEPQQPGAVVAVNHGDYRHQEIWVRSGANIGCWYPLGSEFGWAKPETVPAHPHWEDVLARGPVTLLVPGAQAAYAAGWRNGRRRLREQVEAMEDEEPTDEG